MTRLVTDRLVLRELREEDADFIVSVFNDEAFLRFVGDRNVRNAEEARGYIRSGPVASYLRHGFGLYLVERRDDGARAGVCGLLQREELPAPDLGYAFLPPFRARGFAREAAAAVLEDAAKRLGLPRVLAVVDPENEPSIRLLANLGMRLAENLDTAPQYDGLHCYVYDCGGGACAGRDAAT